MRKMMADRRHRIGNVGWLAALLLAAFWLGSAIPPRTAATAEAPQAEAKDRLLAGDERSLPILKEIAVTVKQIDARLERLEKLLPAPRQP
jgi:hypothetical protein